MNISNLKAGPAYTFGLVGIFLGVSLLAAGIYHIFFKPYMRRLEINRRMSKGRNQHLSQVQLLKNVHEMEGSALEAIAKHLGAMAKIDNLQRNLMQADIYCRAGNFLAVVGLLMCAGFILTLIKGGIYAALGAAAFMGYAPFAAVRFKKNRKTTVIEKQMPDAMELLARSLRAGHALPSSIELAGKEIANPLGTEMKTVYDEQRLGLSVAGALKRMGERVASQDLQYFVTAVMLQSETGGNLAEVMENIGYLIRERLKLKGKIQALVAEGKFSALILALLPFVIFFALIVINRNYIDTLFTDPMGKYLIGMGILNIVAGIIWMKRLIRVDF
jgi:tight adherence protein B